MIQTGRRRVIFIAAVATLLGAVPSMAGQAPAGPGGWTGEGPGMRFLGLDGAHESKVVRGAPYSAQAVTERTQVLSDGNRIDQKTTAQVYRDSLGRTRRETRLGPIGPWGTPDNASPMVLINDPVAGTGYVLNPANHTAVKHSLSARNASAGPPPDGAPERHAARFERTSGQDTVTESLGRQTMQGLEVEGTRTTVTIPAGTFGNEQPVRLVSERWYSPALQVVMMSKHTDPRFGETVYQLTNISLAEPGTALFEVSPDYAISERGRFSRRTPPLPPDTN